MPGELKTFSPTTALGNNKKGLKRNTRSISTANITGTGMNRVL